MVQLEEEPDKQLSWKRYAKDAKRRWKDAKEKKRQEEKELEEYFVQMHGSHAMAGASPEQVKEYVEGIRGKDRRRRVRRDEVNLTALTSRQHKQVRWRNYWIQAERGKGLKAKWATEFLQKIPQRPGINEASGFLRAFVLGLTDLFCPLFCPPLFCPLFCPHPPVAVLLAPRAQQAARMDPESLACAPTIAAELSEPVRIAPWLFMGGLTDAMDLPRLREIGITHILNLCTLRECPNFFEKLQGVHPTEQLVYLRVPVKDQDDFDLPKWLARTSSFIHHVFTRPGTKVLVHCSWVPEHMSDPPSHTNQPKQPSDTMKKRSRTHLSVVKNFAFSRSAAVVMAYLVASLKLHLAQAYRIVRLVQPEAAPREAFLAHLAEWEIEKLGCTSVGGEAARQYQLDELWRSPEVMDATCECTQVVEIDLDDKHKASKIPHSSACSIM
jgi:hypothetical protein